MNETIDVDYYVPGCAPPPDLIINAVNAILKGELPEKGAVLAPDKALCATCKRAEHKPAGLSISQIKRPYEIISDPEKCFLEEGLICLGPATRDGCGQRCINANMPCRGCFGPTSRIDDYGAKFLSGLASIFAYNDEEQINKIVESIPDPAGTFYRFSVPTSLMKGIRERRDKDV